MKKLILSGCLLVLAMASQAQVDSLSLEEAYEKAIGNYPLAVKKGLIRESAAYPVANARTARYPQLTLGGQATYQSDVPHVPIDIPSMPIEIPSKDQYKVFGEISQTLYNGGRVNHQVQLERTLSKADEQQLETHLYQLRERIQHLFFGILLADRQIAQVELTEKEISSAIERTKAAVENGTALASDLYTLQAGLLKASRRKIELRSIRQAYASMLEQFTGSPITGNTQLIMPDVPIMEETVNRPEIKLYELRKETIEIQKNLVQAKVKPSIGLFFQGGYGRPGLNVLSNEFEPYYIGGIRFTWSLGQLYTHRNEREILNLQRKMVETEKETFLFNTQASLQEQLAGIQKWKALIETDREILELRNRVLATAHAQLDNGVVTPHDYLEEVLACEEARQDLLLHQIQLLMAQYNYNTIAGN